ncbi:MAG: ABC transporter permease [Cyclobacteriaceae bacterium]
MISEYLKTTLRSLAKNKLISTINIIGLAISLAAFIFIYKYVDKELSYDQSHPHHERLYRLAEMIESENYLENSSSCPYPTGPALVKEYPDIVENQVRLFNFQTPIVTLETEDKRKFNQQHVYFTDTSIFSMLDYTMVRGNPETALDNPFTAVISTDLAKKYFGDADPIGQKFVHEGFNQNKFEITGIFEQGSISHIKTEVLMSMQTVEANVPFLRNQWVWNPAWTYVKLSENASIEDLEENKFPQFVDKFYDERSRDMTSHYLMPIKDVHLKSHLEFEMAANSDIKYVYIFISCALFLILIAVVNFINLSTSFSLLRAKEIGVRKVSGATRTQLVFQFLSESVIIALISFLIALGICFLSTSFLHELIGLSVSDIFSVKNLALQFGIVLIIGLVSGVYPAFFISSFDPLLVFKGKFISNTKGQLLRKGLVISQFSIAIILIIFTNVTYQQLQLLNNKDYGYHSDNVVILNAINANLNQRLDAFKGALKSNSSVLDVTIMSDIIGTNNNNHDFHHDGMAQGENNFYPALLVDERFVETMGLEVVAGRDFNDTFDNEDSLSVLINMAMVKTLGYTNPEDVLGKQMRSNNGNERIIGVVRDFNYKSFHSEIGPFILDVPRRGPNGNFFFRNIAIRVNDVDNQSLAHIRQTWEEFVPQKPFTYKVLDTELKSMYKSENNLGQILGIFAILTVIIACLGLFALATFIAQQKTKEIGIRKVLGAGTLKLFFVGYKEQFFLILISLLISAPVAYFIVDKWLADFAYRINLGVLPFLVAGLLAILISSLTVLSNFYKTITADPAEVLRDE